MWGGHGGGTVGWGGKGGGLLHALINTHIHPNMKGGGGGGGFLFIEKDSFRESNSPAF